MKKSHIQNSLSAMEFAVYPKQLPLKARLDRTKCPAMSLQATLCFERANAV